MVGGGGQFVIRFDAERRARLDPAAHRSFSLSLDVLGKDGRMYRWRTLAPLVDGYRKGCYGGSLPYSGDVAGNSSRRRFGLLLAND